MFFESKRISKLRERERERERDITVATCSVASCRVNDADLRDMPARRECQMQVREESIIDKSYDQSMN